MDRKHITAEGPSCELRADHTLVRLPGHTYPAPHEPVRFIPYDLDITVRALESAGWWGRFASFQTDKRRKAEAELETARELIKCYEGRIRGLVQDNGVYKGFWTQEQAEHKRLGELAAGLRAQLETARKYIDMSVERPHLAAYYAKQAQKALAQIGAGQVKK